MHAHSGKPSQGRSREGSQGLLATGQVRGERGPNWEVGSRKGTPTGRREVVRPARTGLGGLGGEREGARMWGSRVLRERGAASVGPRPGQGKDVPVPGSEERGD